MCPSRAHAIYTSHLSPKERIAMSGLNNNDERCEALFASALQRSDALTAEAVGEAISQAVRALGATGCASRMAQEFGDHPEEASARMRWARRDSRRPVGLSATVVAVTFVSEPRFPGGLTGRSPRPAPSCAAPRPSPQGPAPQGPAPKAQPPTAPTPQTAPSQRLRPPPRGGLSRLPSTPVSLLDCARSYLCGRRRSLPSTL